MRSKEEIENALEYYKGKWPSILRNENDATIASMNYTILTLEWALGVHDRL